MSKETKTEKTAGPYDSDICNQFVRDMQAAGIPVRHYRGRNFYTGPAAVSDRDEGLFEQDIIRATEVKLQHDNMGLEWILYPVASGNLINPEALEQE
jgi:hypothetical protein